MTVAQQIIINMVMNNNCIRYFEAQDVCSYKFFTYDFKYLEFVRARYLESGSVTLGELMSKFPDFPGSDLNEVSQDCDFLVYQIKENYVYNELARSIEEGQQKFPNDGIQLMGFIEDKIDELRNVIPTHADYDVLEHAKERQEQYLQTSHDPRAFIPTGFPEIDQLIGGWSKSGELGSILARMGMGKTWLLIYSCISAWKAGFKCGYISIEMGKPDIGYRMDTLLSGLSNSALRRGDALDMNAYNNYISSLEGKSGILVRSKKDFKGHITPTKIRNWIESQNLDIVFIDGIGYVENERANAGFKNESSTTTDVAEDLMSVSTDTHCPIILTHQANRQGADRSLNPGLESARGSDGVNINASFVMSIAYPEDSHQVISIEVLKCRYGAFGAKYNYTWDPDHGYIQSRGEVNQGGAFYGNNTVSG